MDIFGDLNVTASLVGLFGFGVLVGLANKVERITQLSAFYPLLQPPKKKYKITLAKMQ